MRAKGIIGNIEQLGITSKVSESSKIDVEEAKKKLIISLNSLLQEVKRFEAEIKFEMRKVSLINRDDALEDYVARPTITLDSIKAGFSNLEYMRWYITGSYN